MKYNTRTKNWNPIAADPTVVDIPPEATLQVEGPCILPTTGTNISLSNAITDPGSGKAIPVTSSGRVSITTGASGETNTLAAPTFLGQRMLLLFKTDGGGDRVITVAAAFDTTPHTIITLANAGQAVELLAIHDASGGRRWWLTLNVGTVGLS